MANLPAADFIRRIEQISSFDSGVRRKRRGGGWG